MRRRVIPGSLPHRTWGSSCIERSISRRRRLITHVQRNSPKDSNDTAGHGGGNDSGDEDAKRDGGEGCPEPEVQHIGHQGAGPGPGPRQRDCHEDDQPMVRYFFTIRPLRCARRSSQSIFGPTQLDLRSQPKIRRSKRMRKGIGTRLPRMAAAAAAAGGRPAAIPAGLHRAAPAQAPWQ